MHVQKQILEYIPAATDYVYCNHNLYLKFIHKFKLI